MRQIGDLIQWTCHGSDQFIEPKKIINISACGEYCFIEGSFTGIPVEQTTVIPQASEKFTFFWDGPFSQWYPSNFVIENVHYSHAEQYMMASKAALFNDDDIYRKIMRSTSPSDQKRFGRSVRNFNEARWNIVVKDIVYTGNYAKFSQNKDLLKKLLETVGTTLVEASPYDKLYGIGLAAKDPRAQTRATWQGKNWLGEVLTQLREDLRAIIVADNSTI